MKKLVVILLMLGVSVAHAQDIITKNVGDFNKLKIFNKIKVTLVKANENKVEITGAKRKKINIVQNNNLLKISMSLDNIWDISNTEVIVYYKELQKIDVNEGSRIESREVISSNSLDLRAQEGASIAAKIEAEHLFVKAISGGEIEIKGEVKEQEVVIASGGKYYAKNLKSTDTQVKISAGGTAEVSAKNYIKANTNAGGTIKIFGKPRQIDSQKLLGGKIIEVN